MMLPTLGIVAAMMQPDAGRMESRRTVEGNMRLARNGYGVIDEVRENVRVETSTSEYISALRKN